MKVFIIDNSKKSLFSFPFPGNKGMKKKKLLFQKEVQHTMQKCQVQRLTLYWALPPQDRV
jgi:hypothetical protein